ncbi:alkaline phosphatase D [Tamaricihabitans halophyticus]|uniref:Alkaline phosphatase D n=1 Tax=Tamaricihabitans halophyticus TaxID=1262583 RepID=A0A4R2QH59_9PSEU|nr:alkaline phosphatase D family protein [Tamaricihabitans halophyticus]TCP48583.1 alkaline phosphatase D [Tamaricihabitans halophyticus]
MTEQNAFPTISRRTALRAGFVGAGALATGLLTAGTSNAAPALVRSDRPVLTHGVQSGDVTARSAIVWTRADRPSRMYVEISPDESFRAARRVRGPLLTPDTGGTGQLRLPGLTPGKPLHYRVTAEEITSGARSEPVTGVLRTAPVTPTDIRLLWAGDVAGQGWGINPDIGGMPIFRAMLAREPDLFLHSGDTVYADHPLAERVTLPDGRVWRNLLTPEKEKVAETLDEYRGQWAYNLLDEPFREFLAAVPSYVQWDDHEVVNNWYPGEILDLPEYTEKNVDVLAARALRAFHEWQPIDRKATVDGRVYRSFRYGPQVEVFVLDMRSHRDANTADPRGDGRILGEKQTNWLINALNKSTATWKIVQSDMPIGLIIPDDEDMEGVSNGLPGEPGGREVELAKVLKEIARRQVRNVVWVTADVHYTAAHHYAPERAAFRDFAPFWEFVSGPLHAGSSGTRELDPTFGPRVEFQHAPDYDASPLDNFRHFGELEVSAGSGELTVHLRDAAGAALWSKTLRPE